jgi:hypothetical protein
MGFFDRLLSKFHVDLSMLPISIIRNDEENEFQCKQLEEPKTDKVLSETDVNNLMTMYTHPAIVRAIKGKFQ